MSIALSPENKAFVEREIAAGNFKSEADAVERALALYEHHLSRVREAIAEAERDIAEGRGVTLTADQHLAQIRAHAAKNH